MINIINEYMLDYVIFIMPALLVLIIILFIIILVMSGKQRKFRKRIDKFLGSSSERHNIEAMLNSYLHQVKTINDTHNELLEQIKNINIRMISCVQKVGLVRYNPFDDVGGDLSFALALLNENNDGIIINNLYSRDSCYTYAKPVKDGKAVAVKFSEEEEKALNIAINQQTFEK